MALLNCHTEIALPSKGDKRWAKSIQFSRVTIRHHDLCEWVQELHFKVPALFAQTEKHVNAYGLYTYVLEASEREMCSSFHFLLRGQAAGRTSKAVFISLYGLQHLRHELKHHLH
jgi:hypothetical protein